MYMYSIYSPLLVCLTGVSCRPQGDGAAHRFITERGILSYNLDRSALSRQSSHRRHSLYSIHSDLPSPWHTRYPSMSRPRHSPGVFVLGKKITTEERFDEYTRVRVCLWLGKVYTF